MKICSFFGHRDVLDDIDETLQAHIRYAIQVLEITDFYVGGYGAFDRKVADVMVAIRQEYAHVKLFLSLAYLNTTSAREYDTKRYDGTVFLEGLECSVKRFAITKRNRLMVGESDVIICYITHNHGGAYSAVNYAQKQGKAILNCAQAEWFSLMKQNDA